MSHPHHDGTRNRIRIHMALPVPEGCARAREPSTNESWKGLPWELFTMLTDIYKFSYVFLFFFIHYKILRDEVYSFITTYVILELSL